MEKILSKLLLNPSPQYLGILNGLGFRQHRQEHPRADNIMGWLPSLVYHQEPQEGVPSP